MKIVVRLKTEEKMMKIRIIESPGLIEYVHCTKSSIIYKIYIFSSSLYNLSLQTLTYLNKMGLNGVQKLLKSDFKKDIQMTSENIFFQVKASEI